MNHIVFELKINKEDYLYFSESKWQTLEPLYLNPMDFEMGKCK